MPKKPKNHKHSVRSVGIKSIIPPKAIFKRNTIFKESTLFEIKSHTTKGHLCLRLYSPEIIKNNQITPKLFTLRQIPLQCRTGVGNLWHVASLGTLWNYQWHSTLLYKVNQIYEERVFLENYWYILTSNH